MPSTTGNVTTPTLAGGRRNSLITGAAKSADTTMAAL